MSSAKFTLIKSVEVRPQTISFQDKLADHNALIDGYIDTLYTRNYSERTINYVRHFLPGWFTNLHVPDDDCVGGYRQLFVWEAMTPVLGRQYIVAFGKGLVCSGLKVGTVISYLGYLRRFFDYILEFPYIPGKTIQYIAAKYGPIEQPVSEYDYPTHVLDPEPEGFPLTLKELVEFYDFVRSVYIPRSQKKSSAARDYSMIVIAGESGLRPDETGHLEEQDLFFERGRIQTRFAKGTKGSGKRTRKTIFTPFAQATTLYYKENIRPQFINFDTEPLLYLSERGGLISYSAMWRNLKRITEAARKEGLQLRPEFCWYDLRRTFATLFAERYPERMWLLMDMLGHLNPSTLKRYVRHRRAYYERSLDLVLDDLIPEHFHP